MGGGETECFNDHGGTVSVGHTQVSIVAGRLYVVATPIGNLGDMSPRAVEVLRGVSVIAAEDTRHSAPLLRHFAIATPMVALHEHNERQQAEKLVARLHAGEAIALISDAGTPLLSDPGYHLVRAAHLAGARVIPVPGASALIAALSASGLPTDRFSFEGFLPAKATARRARLTDVQADPRTLIFYEAPHRIVAALDDMAQIFGAGREAVLARELTKLYETIRVAPLGELAEWVRHDGDQQKGELVVLVRGAESRSSDALNEESRRVLSLLLAALPLKQAVALAAEITGEKRNRLYDQAVKIKAVTSDE